jgi:predicted  nucleic acid-binding Zn-ribbon protein
MGKSPGSVIAIFVPVALALGGAIWWGVDMHKKVNNFGSKADLIDTVSSKQTDSQEKVALIDFINKDMAQVKEYLNKVDHTIGPLARESHQFAKVYKQVEELSKKFNNISAHVKRLDVSINERFGNIEGQLSGITQEQNSLKNALDNEAASLRQAGIKIKIIEDTLPKFKRKR